jgi:hypothetical protein
VERFIVYHVQPHKRESSAASQELTSQEFVVTVGQVLNSILYMYKPFMLSAKLSICIFFLRLFDSSPRLKYAVWIAIVYNVILQTTAFFLVIFLCMPGSSKFWQCSDKISVVNVITAGFNIFSDFYLLAIPLFAVWRLNMKTRRKIAVLLVFAVGIL